MAALYLVFFASGAAALLFETLWFRQAGLMMGNTVWTSSLVVSSFMAGLALGNGLAAWKGSRAARPVRTYAGLEILIAATGAGLVLLFPLLPDLGAPLFHRLAARPALLNGTRVAVAFALMVVPATAMGATLPLLARALEQRDSSFRRVLGRLYGWNTLGAVAGCLVGELVLIPQLGVRGTGAVAALLDLGAAAAALFVAHRWTRTPSEDPLPDDRPASARSDGGPAAAGDEPSRSLPDRVHGRALIAAAFLSGALLLALEVVWFRFLVLFAMATSRVFAFMLATVLLGIAGGGLLGALRPRADVRRLLPLVALGAGLTAAYTYAAFADVLRSLGGGHLMTDLPTGAACAALILPTSLLSGALFTMTGAALRRGLPNSARAAGTLTLANTTGAMLGGLVGGFVLLPRLGVERSIFALAAGYGLVALLLFPWGDGPRPARWLRAATAGGAAAFVALLALFPFGLMRNHYLPLAARPWTGDGSRIVAVREGLTETILYLRTDRWGQPIRYRLVTNGFSMSSSSSFQARRYMNLFAYWPLALHPDPRKALLISYGVGSTAKTLTDTPWLQSIDVVDVSRDILDLSRMLFAPPERHPLDDPRVRVHLEDGRFFLLTSTERYDIITGEPPPPKVAGIGSLYSREYFQRLHSHLAEGGLATYWLPLSQLEHADALAILRAFCDAFEDCSLWTAQGTQFMMAGTRGARGPATAEAFGRQWREPTISVTLRALGFDQPEQLGSFFVADATALREITRETPPLDDDHPLRLSPRMPAADAAAHDFFFALSEPVVTRPRFAASALIRRLWPEAVRAGTLARFEDQEIVNRFYWRGAGPGGVGLGDVERLLRHSEVRTPVLWLLGSDDEQERAARRALGGGVDEPLLHETLGASSFADRDYAKAESWYARAQSGSADPERVAVWRTFARIMSGDEAGARTLLREAVGSGPLQHRAPWQWLAQRLGEPDPFSTVPGP